MYDITGRNFERFSRAAVKSIRPLGSGHESLSPPGTAPGCWTTSGGRALVAQASARSRSQMLAAPPASKKSELLIR